MIIQINTDNNIKGSEEMSTQLSNLVAEKLSRFSEQITRVGVHLVDEDGNKDGQNDKRCVLEARIEGMKPVAVTNHANSYNEAVEGAIDKLKSSLETTLGRLSNRN